MRSLREAIPYFRSKRGNILGKLAVSLPSENLASGYSTPSIALISRRLLFHEGRPGRIEQAAKLQIRYVKGEKDWWDSESRTHTDKSSTAREIPYLEVASEPSVIPLDIVRKSNTFN